MNWSLKKKLYTAFGAIVSAVAVLGVVVFVSLREEDRISADQARLQHLALDAQTLNTLIAQAHKHRQDFLAHGQDKEKQLHAQRLREIEAVDKRITARLGPQDTTLTKELEAARASIDRYARGFAASAAAVERRGTADSGNEVEFRKAANDLEQAAQADGDDALRIVVLRMLRSEKDYLLRRGAQYADLVRADAAMAKGLIARSGVAAPATSDSKPRKGGDKSTDTKAEPSAHAPAPRMSAEAAAKLSSALDAYLQRFESAVAATRDIERIENELRDITDETERRLADLGADAGARAERADADSDQLQRTTEIVLTSLIAAVLVLSLLVARVISGQLGSSVGALANGTKAIASGDLRTKVVVKSADELGELGDSFNLMVDSLRDMTTNISTATVTMEDAVNELTATVSEQAASLQQQATAVNETVATSTELARSSEQVSEVARRVLDEAGRSVETSTRGLDAIRQSVAGMNDVREQVQNIARTILDLSGKTQQIGMIITTVDDFAERSSLLALNASIEAARAGEAGKAFGVVANEVKSLAEQSQRATERVRAILNDIQQATHTAVLVTEEGEKRVERGVQLASSAGDIITSLSSAIDSAADSAKHIAAAARQQTSGIEQISTAMAGIEQFSRQNVQATKQTETTALSIAAVSKQLKSTTTQYRI